MKELLEIGCSIVDHVWWGVVAYVVSVQVHNGLVHIGNMIGQSTKAVLTEAARTRGAK